MASREHNRIEFGDWQTPAELAESVCRVLVERASEPACVVEPTCGKSSFLAAEKHCEKQLQFTNDQNDLAMQLTFL